MDVLNLKITFFFNYRKYSSIISLTIQFPPFLLSDTPGRSCGGSWFVLQLKKLFISQIFSFKVQEYFLTLYFSPSIDFLISVIVTFQNSFLLFLDCLFYSLIKKIVGNSLAVQWLSFHTLAAGPGLMPKPQHSQKKKFSLFLFVQLFLLRIVKFFRMFFSLLNYNVFSRVSYSIYPHPLLLCTWFLVKEQFDHYRLALFPLDSFISLAGHSPEWEDGTTRSVQVGRMCQFTAFTLGYKRNLQANLNPPNLK